MAKDVYEDNNSINKIYESNEELSNIDESLIEKNLLRVQIVLLVKNMVTISFPQPQPL